MAPVVAAVSSMAKVASSRSPMRGLRCSFQMRGTISPVVYSTWSSSALRVIALESLNN